MGSFWKVLLTDFVKYSENPHSFLFNELFKNTLVFVFYLPKIRIFFLECMQRNF